VRRSANGVARKWKGCVGKKRRDASVRWRSAAGRERKKEGDAKRRRLGWRRNGAGARRSGAAKGTFACVVVFTTSFSHLHSLGSKGFEDYQDISLLFHHWSCITEPEE
jgi:hypothetical protein